MNLPPQEPQDELTWYEFVGIMGYIILRTIAIPFIWLWRSIVVNINDTALEDDGAEKP